MKNTEEEKITKKKNGFKKIKNITVKNGMQIIEFEEVKQRKIK